MRERGVERSRGRSCASHPGGRLQRLRLSLGIPGAQLGDLPVGVAKASLTGEPTQELPGTVGQVLPNGAIAVAAADEWIAVRRMWHKGRYVGPREICAPGDRLGDGRFEG